ncbi:MAG TPA: ABC transporter substrate-binding protein, partial [Microbacteriaceae bacterium]|nr:ABC transporter substrate-binding protein [Microbacteriaceae bacterium]
TTLSYGLWDANQAPAYQQCAADFHKANPKITVKVEQLGWDDYWSKITTGFVSGDNYDVFTSHLSQFP